MGHDEKVDKAEARKRERPFFLSLSGSSCMHIRFLSNPRLLPLSLLLAARACTDERDNDASIRACVRACDGLGPSEI